ncbi:hypothetical protein [Christiangramia aquimixticola]|uniref:hypothetical protein n=1 Tax=Christiangramia aquimixticola TaxID=1697558 RepID=UPI003AA8D3AF
MKVLMLFLVLYSYFPASVSQQDPKTNIYAEILCPGEQIQIGNRSIKFRQVISDSRCPVDDGVTCIWAGEVKVLLEVFEMNKSIGNLEFSKNASLKDFFKSAHKMEVKVMEVFPAPRLNQKIAPEEYRISFRVTETLQP